MVSKVAGCWSFEFECAPLYEASYCWEGARYLSCLTSVARGTDAELKIGS